MMTLDTCDLVNELITREGVEEHVVEPFDEISITTKGPARILVVKD